MDGYIKCPFCGQGDYDLIGLKNHLVVGGIFNNTCEAFDNIESVDEERERKSKQ